MRLRNMIALSLAAGMFALAGYAAAEDFWTTDWDKAMAAARAQKKPVVVDFYTDWCGWCKKLDKETYGAPETGGGRVQGGEAGDSRGFEHGRGKRRTVGVP